MPTALFLSPHLDDVAFSCGGTFAALAAAGWRCALLTAFTRSVPNPAGFALACQTDKGLPPDADYLAIRRAEDAAAARVLGAADVIWLDFPEAPHRGYGSAAALFAGVRPGDDVWRPLADRLADVMAAAGPDLVFAPQGCGNHVDHLQLIRAVGPLDAADRTLWYRDTPYVIRDPAAPLSRELPAGLADVGVDVGQTLSAKAAACRCYATQLEFQFGGPDRVADALAGLATAEADRLGTTGHVERFRLTPGGDGVARFGIGT